MKAKAIPPLSGLQIERFWSCVEIGKLDQCWVWKAYKNAGGYGLFGIGESQYLAHRVSFSFHHGLLNPDLIVLHSCDNPPCVNPQHLRSGKAADNSSDAVNRGRTKPFGKSHQHLFRPNSHVTHKSYSVPMLGVKVQKKGLFTEDNREEIGTFQKPVSISSANNLAPQRPLVTLLDFDGTVLSHWTMKSGKAALAFARSESCRVDSAYAIIDGKIHFFRYGMLFGFPGETSCSLAMSA